MGINFTGISNIELVRPTDEEGWFTGRLEKSGLRGNLPGNFVRFREDPPGPPLRAQFNDQVCEDMLFI